MKPIFSKLLILCVSTAIISSCGIYSTIPSNVKYSQELASSDLLKQHSDYFLKAYEGTKKDEAYWGYLSIVQSGLLSVLYDVSIKALASDVNKNFLKAIPSVNSALKLHLSFYGDTWSKAISNNANNEYISVDFTTALAVCENEYKRTGVFDKVENIKELIKTKTSLYERDKFPRTYEVYGLITQLISLVEKPAGSLISFNQTVNSLEIELTKVLALAELEHQQ